MQRIDRGVRLEPRLDKATGYLRADARLTRAGVFAYVLDDGTVRRELRAPEEVFHADSLASLRAVPVTNDHPMVGVTSENATQFAKGSVGDRVDVEDPYLKASVSIWDAATIREVNSGKQELSCGYATDIVPGAGIWNGIRYDAAQTNIRYNHVAVVQLGRAGPNVRLRMDSGAHVPVGECDSPLLDGFPEELIRALFSGGPDLSVLSAGRLDEMRVFLDSKGLSAERADALLISAGAKPPAARKGHRMPKEKEEPEARADAEGAGAANIVKMQARIDALTESQAALQAKLDAADKQRADIEADVTRRADARAKLLLFAAKVAPELKTDGLDNSALMCSVLLAKVDAPQRDALKERLDAGGPAYVQARFDMLSEVESTRVDSSQKLADATRAAKESGGEARSDSETARAEMLSKWKKNPVATSAEGKR